ncbi:3-dehydroquinate synthase [Georgenia satyanarayanai]|uniref:3-dehydroquinate synthase n=1 Tax=Georgenia satyanarayanai TaxID=860221 RepID=A0A2Y8ZXW1_9MICO|nr:3-dehydroquinate synthase [Georgenia satyanarayanai]PYG02113.1 3-dehydroquinate synthase [Georgenia satyanarayanai]SSA36924.1 3-dehydroquinate synthase [Georgenia satyanarayanai]
MIEARVPVRAEHEYEVVIGRGLDREVAAAVGGEPRRVLLVHQAPLAERAGRLGAALEAAGHEVHPALVPDGEQAKTAAVLTELWSRLGRAAFTRQDLVVGLGGGAATDLAGFVAASWLRGVAVVHVPTTLLGMVDAAVGGKAAINTPEGKNLVGAFHSPRAVVCDLDTLATLPPEDHAAGLAEVVKAGFIADPRILELVEADSGAAARDAGSDVLAELVRRAVQVKAEVVSEDLREAGRREFLNYGHTLAHAIELSEDFRWRHGDAVAVGMVFAAELGRAAGRLPDADVARHRDVLRSLGLPTGYRQDRWPELLEAMGRDKKTRGATLRLVVLDGIGRPGRLEGPDPALLEAAYATLAQ